MFHSYVIKSPAGISYILIWTLPWDNSRIFLNLKTLEQCSKSSFMMLLSYITGIPWKSMELPEWSMIIPDMLVRIIHYWNQSRRVLNTAQLPLCVSSSYRRLFGRDT